MRRLNTVKSVIDALGGTTRFARWYGSPRGRVSMWKNRNRFPPELYEHMKSRLADECRIEASPSLWGQVEVAGFASEQEAPR